jgi:hypothetical protein
VGENWKTNSQEHQKEAPTSRFSLLTFPRRFTHPASGRSPDSRFSELAAFPILTADQWHVG